MLKLVFPMFSNSVISVVSPLSKIHHFISLILTEESFSAADTSSPGRFRLQSQGLAQGLTPLKHPGWPWYIPLRLALGPTPAVPTRTRLLTKQESMCEWENMVLYYQQSTLWSLGLGCWERPFSTCFEESMVLKMRWQWIFLVIIFI